MRSTKEIAKKCMAIATALTLVGGMAVGIPASVYALNNPHEGTFGQVNVGESITNRGVIDDNYGSVQNDTSTSEICYEQGYPMPVVINNQAGGTVSGAGSVRNNYGTVTGSGIVNNNYNGGIVNGTGNINYNRAGGIVNGTQRVGNNWGTVNGDGDITRNEVGGTANGANSITYNWGNVTNSSASVTNHYSGALADNVTVENNYSDNSSITATNTFFSVTITGFNNSEAAYTSGFSNANNKKFLQTTNNGTITITPNEGYEINGDTDTGTNFDGGNFTYSLETDGNNVIVTLSSPEGAVTISPVELNLLITAIQQGGGNVVVRTDSSVTVSEDETGSNRTVSDTAPATGNVVTAAQISAMIESALAANPDATVLDIDLGNDPSLDADAVLALCDIKIAKRCHFTHNGMKFVLFVPVVDTDSASFKQCLALIDAEEGKQAGPIRLSLLFKPVGFDCLGE